MAFSLWRNATVLENKALKINNWVLKCVRYTSSTPETNPIENEDTKEQTKTKRRFRGMNPAYNPFRFIYPEFLPYPSPSKRHSVKEKLERIDILNRRIVIDIPEFYVGSVMAVKLSDPNALGKATRFVGICVEKASYGLFSNFTLRNVVDSQGVEIRYDTFDPLIQSIQVLRLEKRLDDRLYYLRDAPAEYSTFSFDMEPEILPENTEVPVNRIQIELNPRPWHEKWQLQDLKGVINLDKHLGYKAKERARKHATPWEKYDLMKEYRQSIPEEEQNEIWTDVYSKLSELEMTRKKLARKRTFVFPVKRG